MSTRAPKIHLALQYVIRNFFRIDNIIAVRLGKGVHKVRRCAYADGCTLIHYADDLNPNFRYYESQDTSLDIQKVTRASNSRIC